MDNPSSLRRFLRIPLNSKGSLVYTDEHGVTCAVRFKVTDISRQGVGLEAESAIPLRTYVNFKLDKPAMTGAASVRFCARSKVRYTIGLEFSGGLEWLEPEGAPPVNAD